MVKRSEEWVPNIKQKKAVNLLSTLNGSGKLAVGRLLIALLENNQNEDGQLVFRMF